MAQNVTLYNLLISCPGDIKKEVTLIEAAVDEFNELYAETLGITIKTRHWSNMLKSHSEEIFSCLDSYPEYFKDRLSVLMK